MTEHLELRLAHSPDPDDAFMWWPLVGIDGSGPEIDTGRWRFELVPEDIETLNELAEQGTYEITAISCAQYPTVRDRYALTSSGASLGDGYGPRLVSKQPMDLDAYLLDPPVTAVPGARTSALATCRMLLGGKELPCEVVPFETIIEHVAQERFKAGLVIHEGQLTFADSGLHLVVDLGAWWRSQTGLPLPLGGNAIRRDIETMGGPGSMEEVAGILRNSVEWAMSHKDRAIDWALNWGRGIDRATAEAFVDLYVNRWTVDLGKQGTEALRKFFSEASRLGVLPDAGALDIIGHGAALADSQDA